MTVSLENLSLQDAFDPGRVSPRSSRTSSKPDDGRQADSQVIPISLLSWCSPSVSTPGDLSRCVELRIRIKHGFFRIHLDKKLSIKMIFWLLDFYFFTDPDPPLKKESEPSSYKVAKFFWSWLVVGSFY